MKMWSRLSEIIIFRTLFLDSRFQNHPDSVTIQKYQIAFKPELYTQFGAYTVFKLTPNLSDEPRFCMYIVNGYYTKTTDM